MPNWWSLFYFSRVWIKCFSRRLFSKLIIWIPFSEMKIKRKKRKKRRKKRKDIKNPTERSKNEWRISLVLFSSIFGSHSLDWRHSKHIALSWISIFFISLIRFHGKIQFSSSSFLIPRLFLVHSFVRSFVRSLARSLVRSFAPRSFVPRSLVLAVRWCVGCTVKWYCKAQYSNTK